jgi:hypothetical protein
MEQDEFEAKVMAQFLKCLGDTASITDACKYAEIGRTTAYRWRAKNDDFRKAWDEAQELGTDALEDEAIRRASQGVAKKKFTAKGEPVIDPETGKQYVEHDYSDTMLIFMLKARRPDKFKDRNETMLGGVPGKPVEVIEIIRPAPKA